MKTSVEKLFNLVKLEEQEFDLNIFLKELLRNLNKIFNVEFLVILLTDPTYTELHYRISLRTQEKYFYEYPADFTKVKIGEALVGACAIKLAQQSFSKSDLSEDTKTFYKKYLALEINNSICTPVISRGKLFGVLELVNKKDNSDFSEDEKKIINCLC